MIDHSRVAKIRRNRGRRVKKRGLDRQDSQRARRKREVGKGRRKKGRKGKRRALIDIPGRPLIGSMGSAETQVSAWTRLGKVVRRQAPNEIVGGRHDSLTVLQGQSSRHLSGTESHCRCREASAVFLIAYVTCARYFAEAKSHCDGLHCSLLVWPGWEVDKIKYWCMSLFFSASIVRICPPNLPGVISSHPRPDWRCARWVRSREAIQARWTLKRK
ncbi:uncharacterized protein BO66DRAFT_224032 [Aspergillus aculeatinus CBS 121060]|uniref:Uncharacterized protein n=1 Tax=Aspergillus aculeatinus CBS 121060 TaxID=1448322 RepID=A0ACD1HJA4_9EURO|nr:hypothetical protein BO66DRAFT_224032 [Aspergillus aculeatinus CBS 121060]RAH73495.1 hypothetical protein BO66DRAFT_224032 [Aspergillus aculeatinus CBS 121060]